MLNYGHWVSELDQNWPFSNALSLHFHDPLGLLQNVRLPAQVYGKPFNQPGPTVHYFDCMRYLFKCRYRYCEFNCKLCGHLFRVSIPSDYSVRSILPEVYLAHSRWGNIKGSAVKLTTRRCIAERGGPLEWRITTSKHWRINHFHRTAIARDESRRGSSR